MDCGEMLSSLQVDLLLVMGSSLKVRPVSLVPSELLLFSVCVIHFLICKYVYPQSPSYCHSAPIYHHSTH